MTHEEEMSLLIPRYINGSLPAGERATLEAYMDKNPDFRTEVEFQRNLMAARPTAEETIVDELGWARLSRSIDQLDEDQHNVEDIAPLQSASPFKHMWKIAAVALACLSIAQAAYINTSTPAEYQLASEASLSATHLQIGFAPDITLEDISSFLTDHKAQIVAGPGNLGIYTLSFPDIQHCETAMVTLNSKEQFVETYTSCTPSAKD